MYISLHSCMWHKTPFYMFNKDHMEHVTQVKQDHVECLGSLFGKDDTTFRSFPIKISAMWDARKASFKATVTLFLGKN